MKFPTNIRRTFSDVNRNGIFVLSCYIYTDVIEVIRKITK